MVPKQDDNDYKEPNDDTDSLINNHMLLSQHKNKKLDAAIRPVKRVLTKVQVLPCMCFVDSHIYSSYSATICLIICLLPAWFCMLKKHRLTKKKMSHDVATCWNSTYNMLEFTVEYCVAIDNMTID
ncbi:hypothetical protein OBBRIDRAFT_742785 [Obba rivulosa]|uniref:Uncharacterized protein n=1 Tax=Obba rivulosa TaxID=1052685 RepID=A0A8E2DEB4_9APHY|nr:hypothetical protein OBBRIDRAFT_742785 [Obba rivulosa]